MAKIQLLDEAIRERIYECTDAAHEMYQASVRPIFGASQGLHPELIGSCLLMRVGDSNYVVTAAHITDHLSESELYVGGTVGREPVQILGTVVSTEAPNGDRNKDKLDIAFCSVSDGAIDELGDVTFIPQHELCANRADTTNRIYMAAGYPLSKNRGKVNHAQRSIRTVSWRYASGVRDIPPLRKKMGVSGDDHFFQEYGKYSKDSSGKKVSSVNPKGLSGGAFVDLGDFSSISVFASSHPPAGRLAGMVIEKHAAYRALVAVRIQKVLEAIKQFGG